jgi:CspA family cold shock protein
MARRYRRGDQVFRADFQARRGGLGGGIFFEERRMPSGTVKWFNTVKGFGFIQPDDGSKDVFVHISAVDAAGLSGLSEGQKVEYELVPDNRGRSAAGNLRAVD